MFHFDCRVGGVRDLAAPARDPFSQNAGDVGVDEDVAEALPAGQVHQQVDRKAQVVEDLKHHLQQERLNQSNRLIMLLLLRMMRGFETAPAIPPQDR